MTNDFKKLVSELSLEELTANVRILGEEKPGKSKKALVKQLGTLIGHLSLTLVELTDEEVSSEAVSGAGFEAGMHLLISTDENASTEVLGDAGEESQDESVVVAKYYGTSSENPGARVLSEQDYVDADGRKYVDIRCENGNTYRLTPQDYALKVK